MGRRVVILILGLLLSSFSAVSYCASLTAVPDFIVAIDGSGDFTTIQAAINAAPSNSDRPTVIFIKRGLYNTEKLMVPSDKKNISLVGESRDETVISYLIYNCADGYNGRCPAADAALWPAELLVTSATLTIQGDGFRAENLTIENTAGPVGQAQAITVQADKVVFINCNLTSYQDTLYLWSAGKRCYFWGCLIVGRTDYIYGACIAFFQSCEIRSWGGGWITAPSTPQSQDYGFVFSHCSVTYASDSPRAGDDGSYIRLGRPWHEYPRVTWLYCDMTGMIHPEGWGDTWNMTYAATSTDLHLYEYANTGEGADMSQRAAWAGLRALTDEEALNYTVQKVLGGTDGWDPSADPPMVQEYYWTGAASSPGWLTPENWSPAQTPASGERASVVINDTIVADGGSFAADLIMSANAALMVSSTGTATYISAGSARLLCAGQATLGGRINVTDSLRFDISGTLTLEAALSGIHAIVKRSPGTLVLSAGNSNFSGKVAVVEGIVEATVANALGKGDVEVYPGGTLKISNGSAFYPESKLTVSAGSTLVLGAAVSTSSFFIDGVIQEPGEYTSATNPSLISGTGKVIVGRPEAFSFTGAVNSLWDVAGNYSPELLPLAGEIVYCSVAMETTPTVNPADIYFSGAGYLRLRGNHESSGTLHMGSGTAFYYNTSGTGFSLQAPISVDGNIRLTMESSATDGSTMTLSGSVSGAGRVTALNNGKGTVNKGTVLLTGDNSGFTGTWSLNEYSTKYPGVSGYVTCLDGQSKNAFGAGKIEVGYNNRVIFSNPEAVGSTLVMTLGTDARAVLNSSLTLESYTLNGMSVTAGTYSATTNPELYEGSGTITVTGGITPDPDEGPRAFPGAEGYGKKATGGRGGRVYYVTTTEDNTSEGSLRYAIMQTGPRIILFKVSGTIKLNSPLKITSGDLTIAGQTAPGDGICLRDYPVTVEADNVIIRFMRFRLGDESLQEADALGGRFHKSIIIDHCSMSWSVDECVSFYENEYFTLQWCIISESLRNSVHGKGSHGYGGIWGGRYASFHHNLLAHHDSRNPRLGEVADDVFALTDLTDLRNNVVYNWQGNSCYGGEAMNVNIVNCYYKPGPATTKTERIVAIDKNINEGSPIYNMWGKFFISGNCMSASARATNDNWTYGVYNQFADKYGVVPEEQKADMKLSLPFESFGVTTHSALTAYERVLAYAGASLVRDPVDTRIISEVSTGTATYMDGGNGSINGIIDTQVAVGGWPVLNSATPPDDTDNDGMPDLWETTHDLNYLDPSDALLMTVDESYTNVESYINSLVADIVANQNKDGVMTTLPQPSAGSNSLIVIYNHADSSLSVTLPSQITMVQLFSLDGKLLLSESCSGSSASVSLPRLKSAIYIVRVTDTANKAYTAKFIQP